MALRSYKDAYYKEKPAGRYLYLCCRGHWDISTGYATLWHYIREQGLETAGDFYACDLAGFILNSEKKTRRLSSRYD